MGIFIFVNPTGLYPNPTGLFNSLLDLIKPKISIQNNFYHKICLWFNLNMRDTASNSVDTMTAPKTDKPGTARWSKWADNRILCSLG